MSNTHCNMQYTYYNSIKALLSCYSLRPRNLNSFWIIKTLISLVIYKNLIAIDRNTVNANDAVSVQRYADVLLNENQIKNATQLLLMSMTSDFLVQANNSDNNILAINYFYEKNQIISDNKQQHEMFTKANGSLLAVEDFITSDNSILDTKDMIKEDLSNKSLPATSSLWTTGKSILQPQHYLLSRPKRYLSFPEGSSFSVCSL